MFRMQSTSHESLWLLMTWSLQHMYIHIMLLGVHMHRINFACKAHIYRCGQRRRRTEHSDAWTRSGKVSFSESSKILVSCCSLHLEPQWHVVSSLSLSFHWTLCLCFLVLQVVDCSLLAPLTRTISSNFWVFFCSTLPSSLPLCCWWWHALAALCWPRYESVRLLVRLQHRVFLGVMDVRTYFTDTARIVASH